MKLTLERDNGDKHSIVMDGEPEDRPQAIRMMARLLNTWATERDKDAIEDNGS
jgi:hypothetical protein